MNATPSVNAIVLAGGGSTRFGRNKLNEPLGSQTVLERVINSLDTVDTIVVVGTNQTVDIAKLRWATERTPKTLIMVSEEPAGSGPAMGIAAGVKALTEADSGGPSNRPTLVVAGDMPFFASAVSALIGALDKDNEVAILVDQDGRHQYLATAWNRLALIQATSATKPGDSVRSLINNTKTVLVHDRHRSALDIDDKADLAAATQRIATEGGASPTRQ